MKKNVERRQLTSRLSQHFAACNKLGIFIFLYDNTVFAESKDSFSSWTSGWSSSLDFSLGDTVFDFTQSVMTKSTIVSVSHFKIIVLYIKGEISFFYHLIYLEHLKLLKLLKLLPHTMPLQKSSLHGWKMKSQWDQFQITSSTAISAE